MCHHLGPPHLTLGFFVWYSIFTIQCNTDEASRQQMGVPANHVGDPSGFPGFDITQPWLFWPPRD